MKKFMMIMVMLCLTAQTAFSQAEAPAAEDDSMGITVALDHWSNYLWRGTYWFEGSGAFFPLVTYEIKGSGLSLSVGGEISDAWVVDGKDASGESVYGRQSLDLLADYEYTFDDKITVGASLWYFHMKDDVNSFANAVVSVTYETFLKPTLTYTHDYIVDSKAKEDFYVQLGISHELESANKDGVLELSLVGGYYRCKSYDQSGISDITATVKPTLNFGNASVYAALNVIFVPSEDYYMNIAGVEDKLRYYTVFGSSYSL